MDFFNIFTGHHQQDTGLAGSATGTPSAGRRWLGTGALAGILVFVSLLIGFMLMPTVWETRPLSLSAPMSFHCEDLYHSLTTHAAWPKSVDAATNSCVYLDRLVGRGIVDDGIAILAILAKKTALGGWCIIEDPPANETNGVPFLFFASAKVVPAGPGRFRLQMPGRDRKTGWGIIIGPNGTVQKLKRRYLAALTFPDHFSDGRPVVYLGPEGEIRPDALVANARTVSQPGPAEGVSIVLETVWMGLLIWLIATAVAGGCVGVAVDVWLGLRHLPPADRIGDIWSHTMILGSYWTAIFMLQYDEGFAPLGPWLTGLVLSVVLAHVAAFGLLTWVLRGSSVEDRRRIRRRLVWLPPCLFVVTFFIVGMFMPMG